MRVRDLDPAEVRRELSRRLAEYGVDLEHMNAIEATLAGEILSEDMGIGERHWKRLGLKD